MLSLLARARALGASDVHLTAGKQPVMRVNGLLQPLAAAVVTQAQLEQSLRELLSEQLWTAFLRRGEVDAALTSAGGERLRLNAYRQAGSYAVAVRLLAREIPSCDELGLPAAVQQLAQLERGLVLVAGSTGSGKSTTLAALVQKINCSRAVHVLTLEDPVEYVYPAGQALINQREVGKDTESIVS